MNKFTISISVAMILLSSCARETFQMIAPGETITFKAGWAGAEETKTVLQSDGTSVWWEPGAQINVFFGDKASGKFTSTNSQTQAVVDFKGSLPIVVGSVETENPAHAYWAVYPYNAANTCDGESVTLTIPSNQTAAEGTFSNKMFPSIATSTNFYLAFYNICGGVRFTVANEGISSVTFKAINGESLVGKAQVGFDGVPVVKNVIEGSSEVTVNAPEGGFIPGKAYFAAILPQTLTKGLTLSFSKTNGTYASVSMDQSITINRSRFGKLDEKDNGLEFQGYVDVTDIELDRTSVSLKEGESITLIARVKPDNATDKTVEWSSSNATVVDVDSQGKITALLEGNAVVTATAGEQVARCSVTVTSASFQPNGEYLAFTGLTSDATLSYEARSYNFEIEFSYDTIDWYPWRRDFTISMATGTKIYIRGRGQGKGTSFRFKMTGEIAASGNIMSLLYYDDFKYKNRIDENNTFAGVFEHCKSLIQAPDLPATTLVESCYSGLFQGCVNLTKAPDLPATMLAKSCYSAMFGGCSSLTQAPDLPATTLAEYCYSSMFTYCTSLTKAPDLPATVLAYECYGSMFDYCTSLTQAPSLPATVLASGCYASMFSSCSSLTQAPSLPATVLASGCYGGMFSGCSSLTQAPDLPATSLAEFCYSGMFNGCALTQAPDLPATTLAEYCYSSMFCSCSSLTQAPELPATVLAEGCYSGMFDNCSNITKAPDLPATILAKSCYSSMFYGCWSLTTVPDLPATLLAEECYYSMFNSCYGLTNAPELPAKVLARNCYYNMFSSTGLTKAPELPATVLAEGCYCGMFSGCALTQAPELPATALVERCYSGMFNGCSSLTQAPDLPATTLAEGCYSSMFAYCTSLTKAPDLPATSLANSCYASMFSGCSSLTQAPELPATTLAEGCYSWMFSRCSSLTQAPTLPAKTLVGRYYEYMFEYCGKLEYVKMMALNIPSNNSLSYWLKGVASKGTFVKSSAATWNEDGIVPSGWTVVTTTE